MEIVLAIAAGIALAAACGFRIFLPLLIASVAVRLGALAPAPELMWIGNDLVLIILIVATIFETAAYYVPWLDNMLDTIATPTALLAGTVAAATAFGDLDPVVKWTAALIAGGGAAGVVQGTTVVARAISTATTGGLGNPVVSTVESGAAATLSILAILVPLLALLLVAFVVGYALYLFFRRKRPHPAQPAKA